MTEFKFDDEVFWAKLDNYEYQLKCPDCLGKTFLTVILGDESQVRIDCELCRRGYLGSLGYIPIYQYTPNTELARINRVEMKQEDGSPVVEYGLTTTYRADAKDLFRIESDAKLRAEEKAKELGKLEMERFYKRERDTKSWAWNVPLSS